jgi:hypothetical protein
MNIKDKNIFKRIIVDKNLKTLIKNKKIHHVVSV